MSQKAVDGDRRELKGGFGEKTRVSVGRSPFLFLHVTHMHLLSSRFHRMTSFSRGDKTKRESMHKPKA